jgi:hypothetical protein
MTRTTRSRFALGFTLGLGALAGAACGDAPRPEAPPCDGACKDGVALRATRETVKLAYNLLLQGKPVGEVDASSPCIRGGAVRVVGRATSNAVQGATEVDLTYTFDRCSVLAKDTDAARNYELAVTGTITQQGTLAVQPTATTALILKSAGLTLSGTVYAPALPYDEKECDLDVVQNGDKVGGTLCGRTATFSF